MSPPELTRGIHLSDGTFITTRQIDMIRTTLADLVTSIENDDCEVSLSTYFYLEQARAVLKGVGVTR